MAKKIKKKTHRRRRMGAMGGLDLKTPLMVTAGAVGATYLINGPMKTTSWINIAAIGGGILLAKFMPKAAAVGAGMVAAGGVSILQNANVLSGMGRGVIIHGGPPGSGPLSSIAGRRGMGALPPKAAAAFNTRQAAAGKKRVIIGQMNHPISSIAGYDPCDL
jgi:hypothetical protein